MVVSSRATFRAASHSGLTFSKSAKTFCGILGPKAPEVCVPKLRKMKSGSVFDFTASGKGVLPVALFNKAVRFLRMNDSSDHPAYGQEVIDVIT